MGTNEPITDQTQIAPEPQSTLVPSTPPPPAMQSIPVKKTPYLVIVLVITLVGIVGYFGVQNYQLKQQFASQPTPSQAAIVSSPSPAVDPTENWKVYGNGNYSYNLKYPNTWETIPAIVSGSKTEAIGLHNGELQGKTVYLHSNYSQNPTMPFLQIEASPNETQATYNTRKQSRPNSQEVMISKYPAITSKLISSPEPGTSFNKDGYLYSWFIYNDDLNTIYDITCAEDMANENLCNQVMSTFQFTR